MSVALQGVSVCNTDAAQNWQDGFDVGSRIESDSEAGEEVLKCDT
jgi:hypothetical protein